jgi:drug/metabolite transporter (DMT)-like permease
MLAVRFSVAGVLMYAWLRLRGIPNPSRQECLGSTVVGAFLLLGGTGAVAWAEQWIYSGVAALIVAVMPVWFVLLDWVGPDKRRPTTGIVAGLVLGLLGVVLLIGPVDIDLNGRQQLLGSLAVLGGTLSWSIGSVWGKHLQHPDSPWMNAALQMVMGGVLLLVAGTVKGEWVALEWNRFSFRSVLSLGYLIAFGSLVAFAAYVYLLKHAAPARVASYAYVNPVVAVFLGWLLADEHITLRTVIAASIIITGVALIVARRTKA